MTPERPEHTTTNRARPSAPVEGLDRDAAAAAVRAALVSVDAGERLPVSWWRPTGRGGNVTADQRRADDEGTPDPHEASTLAEIGAELDRVRRERAPKRTNAALCGGSYAPADRDGEAVFLRRAEHLRGVSLLQVDVDGRAGDAFTLAAAARALADANVAALLHPSPSARGYLEAVKFRAWVRVAVEGHAAAPVHHRAADLDHALRATGEAVAAVCFAGARVDRTVWNGGALGYADREHDTAAGPCVVLNGAALDPYAARDALVAVGAWEPYMHGAKGTRDGEALLTMLRELGAHAPGVLGDRSSRGVYCVACPLAHMHTDPSTGRGSDTSCVLHVPLGLLKCSHQHQGRGALSGHTFVAAIAEQWPAFAARAWSLWGEASTRRPDEIRAESFIGAPGDTSDPRVTWDRAPDGAAVVVHESVAAAAAHIIDDMRAELHRWEASEARRRVVRLRLDVTGTGKSTAAARAVVALAPLLPGELDDRRDSPRPAGVVTVENIKAASDVARRIDDAGRGRAARSAHDDGGVDLVETHASTSGPVAVLRGRHARAPRAAVYLPISAVGADGRRVRCGKGDDGDEGEHACPLWREAQHMERSSSGLDVRASLCKFAGTDDPRQLRHAPGGGGKPCPRSSVAGGDCVAEQPWHYSDGTSPRSGDFWIAVATNAAAFAVPLAQLGSLHIVDETERATDPRPLHVMPADVAVDGPAAALVHVLPTDRKKAPRHPLESARGVYRAMLEALRVQGPRVLYEGPTTPAGRRAWAVAVLDAWANEARDESARDMLRAWATMHDPTEDDPTERDALRALYIGAAVDAFMRARPVVSRWRAARWGARGDVVVSAHVWHALQSWLRGAVVLSHHDVDPNDPSNVHRVVPTGGASVYQWSPALLAARDWITRGPVLCLDATGDPSMIASAMNAGDEGSTVAGVRAVATDLRPTADVRRVMVTTDRATRSVLLQGRDDDARVRWTHSKGAGAATLVRAVVAVLGRDGPRDARGCLAPGVVVAPQPIALALRVLYEGAQSVESIARERGDGPGARALADAAAAPDDVRAAVEKLRTSGARIWWTWFGGEIARGSNDPHEGGARWVVTIGDGLVNPRVSTTRARLARRLDASGEPDGTAQQRRDAAAGLAQAHGRVRVRHITGPVLLLHFGGVRPFDWRDDGVQYITLAALRESFRPTASAAPEVPPVEAPSTAPASRGVTLPAPLADALAAGWSRPRIARACGVADRTVFRWCAGETAPNAGHMEALQVSIATATDATRAGYRALMLPGRRPLDLVRGKSSGKFPAFGIVAESRRVAGEAAAHAIRTGVAMPAVEPLDAAVFGKGGEVLRAWVEGRAELAPGVVATLAAVLPSMTRTWVGYKGAPGVVAARPTAQRADVRAQLDRVEARERDRAAPSADASA